MSSELKKTIKKKLVRNYRRHCKRAEENLNKVRKNKKPQRISLFALLSLLFMCLNWSSLALISLHHKDKANDPSISLHSTIYILKTIPIICSTIHNIHDTCVCVCHVFIYLYKGRAYIETALVHTLIYFQKYPYKKFIIYPQLFLFYMLYTS